MKTVGPLYDKEFQCEVCESKFTSKKIRSRFIRSENVHSDFFTEYRGDVNPYFYEVYVCPFCGYSFTDNFSHHFPPGVKEEIYVQITSNWKSRNYGGERTIEEAIQTYKLALLSARIKKEKNIVLAGLAMRLGWLYRMLNDNEQEARFLRLSLGYYEKAYENSDHIGTQMSDMRLLYLIGELHRRVGDREKAIQYLSRVINHKNKAIEPKIVEMAREQWYLIREENKQGGA